MEHRFLERNGNELEIRWVDDLFLMPSSKTSVLKEHDFDIPSYDPGKPLTPHFLKNVERGVQKDGRSLMDIAHPIVRDYSLLARALYDFCQENKVGFVVSNFWSTLEDLPNTADDPNIVYLMDLDNREGPEAYSGTVNTEAWNPNVFGAHLVSFFKIPPERFRWLSKLIPESERILNAMFPSLTQTQLRNQCMYLKDTREITQWASSLLEIAQEGPLSKVSENAEAAVGGTSPGDRNFWSWPKKVGGAIAFVAACVGIWSTFKKPTHSEVTRFSVGIRQVSDGNKQIELLKGSQITFSGVDKITLMEIDVSEDAFVSTVLLDSSGTAHLLEEGFKRSKISRSLVDLPIGSYSEKPGEFAVVGLVQVRNSKNITSMLRSMEDVWGKFAGNGMVYEVGIENAIIKPSYGERGFLDDLTRALVGLREEYDLVDFVAYSFTVVADPK